MTTQRNPLENLVINEFITPRTPPHPLHLNAEQSIEILDLRQFNRESDLLAGIG